jgi:hypothetical protein
MTTDELKRREQLVHLTFVDFFEAIARITNFYPLPTQELLTEHNSRSCAHFFRQGLAGMHKGRALLRKKTKWADEEQWDASLAEPLEMIITLILARLDADGNGGRLTRADLVATRKRQSEEAAAKTSVLAG